MSERKKPKAVRAAVPGRAWAWMIQNHTGTRWELCLWAEPSRESLERIQRPSPEARAVRVLIVRPVPVKRREARRKS